MKSEDDYRKFFKYFFLTIFSYLKSRMLHNLVSYLKANNLLNEMLKKNWELKALDNFQNCYHKKMLLIRKYCQKSY